MKRLMIILSTIALLCAAAALAGCTSGQAPASGGEAGGWHAGAGSTGECHLGVGQIAAGAVGRAQSGHGWDREGPLSGRGRPGRGRHAVGRDATTASCRARSRLPLQRWPRPKRPAPSCWPALSRGPGRGRCGCSAGQGAVAQAQAVLAHAQAATTAAAAQVTIAQAHTTNWPRSYNRRADHRARPVALPRIAVEHAQAAYDLVHDDPHIASAGVVGARSGHRHPRLGAGGYTPQSRAPRPSSWQSRAQVAPPSHR